MLVVAAPGDAPDRVVRRVVARLVEVQAVAVFALGRHREATFRKRFGGDELVAVEGFLLGFVERSRWGRGVVDSGAGSRVVRDLAGCPPAVVLADDRRARR